ncbi:MAG TPA: T9SS type A sorting domain-containing protein [Bacteroidia bacterium]|jgi:hypothetical protein|nr:T9SS type A sorting domain-containing protein [Bacteroidia bacterium]
MSTKLSLSLFLLFTLGYTTVNAQFKSYLQFFDGADTSASSIHVVREPNNASNIWQIGKPHKTIFNMAATEPNVIVTDTVKTYPSNTTSTFTFHLDFSNSSGNIVATRWKQKLDMDKHKDGGIIEFSLDKGVTWQNAFNNPIVHNIYGYNSDNKDTLSSGQYAFSGTDSTWRDVWFCIYLFSNNPSSIDYRFTFKSDAINNQKEGWMIDNLFVTKTMMHIVKENEKSKYLTVYPTATQGIVNIEASKIQDNHVIESVRLFGIDGRLVEEFKPDPSNFAVNISYLPNGIYYLMVNTNLQHEVFPIMLSK